MIDYFFLGFYIFCSDLIIIESSPEISKKKKIIIIIESSLYNHHFPNSHEYYFIRQITFPQP